MRRPVPLTDVMQTGETYIISVPEDERKAFQITPQVGLANRIVLMADISEGQHISAFRLYAYLPTYQKKRILIYQGRTVGHKLICPFCTVRGAQYLLEVTGSDAPVRLRDMKAYFVK